MAEREGFEPPEPFGSTVFKTAAFDHSATSPLLISLGFLKLAERNPHELVTIRSHEAKNHASASLPNADFRTLSTFIAASSCMPGIT